MILDTISGGRWKGQAGANGTFTVPAGYYVNWWYAHATAASTVQITAGGPNQDVTQTCTIPLPAGASITSPQALQLLGPGTVFVFTTTDAYYIEMYKLATG